MQTRLGLLIIGAMLWSQARLVGASVPEPEHYAAEHLASQFSSREFAVRPDGQAVLLTADGDIWLLKPDLSPVGWVSRRPFGTDLTRVTRGGQKASELPWTVWLHRLPTWVSGSQFVYLRSTLLQDPDAEGPVDRELWMGGEGAPRKVASLNLKGPVHAMVPDPSGRRLMLLVSTPQSNPGGSVQVVDLPTGAIRALPTANLAATPAEGAWSPDGRAIALATTREEWTTLYTIPSDGGAPRKLTGFSNAVGPLAPLAMVWAPDGRSLVQHGWERVPPGALPEHAGIWRVPAEGGYPRRVRPPVEGLLWPAWSPDGRWVAYLNSKDSMRYALHVASGQVARLGGWESRPAEDPRFQWEKESQAVWYVCPPGLCRASISKLP